LPTGKNRQTYPMKKTDFFDLIAQPDRLNERSLSALHEIVDEFPWFQTGRMLLVKNLHSIEHVRFNSELKQSAAYIADRKKLFNLIHQTKPLVEKQDAKSEKVKIIKNDEAFKEKSETKKVASGRVGITTKVSSVADYFQTDDVFETADGGQIDFSVSSKKDKEEKKSAMVMPSADFLGYESSEYIGYELKESINPEKKQDESHSFSDWLSMMRHAPIENNDKPVAKKSNQIIDNFLKIETPKIVPTKTATEEPTGIIKEQKSEESDTGDELLSETLANIFIKQKHYNKAIAIYEKLRLKYPEKNVYFARRISDLEKLTN